MRKVFFVITACLESKRRPRTLEESNIREKQYITGIGQAIEWAKSRPHVHVVIVENNGKRRTFLDDLGVPILYTSNNSLPTTNIGTKELQDIRDCIEHFGMQDEDFLIKMTGRYILKTDSKFLHHVDELVQTRKECIIRHGSYKDAQLGKPPLNDLDCITGLIGMSVKHVISIPFPKTSWEWVEWCWAQCSNRIDQSKKISMVELGILICPGTNDYFLA